MFNQKNLLAAYYLVFSLAVLGVGLVRPSLNWDVVGYVAAARALESSDARDIHTFTYDTLRASVTDARFAVIAPGGEGYKAVMYADPAAFAEQLPFYQVRPLYVGLLFVLYKAGVNLVFATYFVSALGVCGGLWAAYAIASRELPAVWLFALPPLAVACGALGIARLSTPDGLAFMGVMLAGALFVRGQRALLLVLPALVAVRTDLALFSVPFLLGLLWQGRFDRRATAAALAAAVLLYFGINWIYHYPGWETVFSFTFVELATHPLSAPPHVTSGQYLSILARGVEVALNNGLFVAYLAAAAAALFLIVERVRHGEDWRAVLREPAPALALLCLLYAGVHFVLFPVAWPRFFAPFYLAGVLALGLLHSYSTSGQRSSLPEPSPKAIARKP
jgi:hypothetical protein